MHRYQTITRSSRSPWTSRQCWRSVQGSATPPLRSLWTTPSSSSATPPSTIRSEGWLLPRALLERIDQWSPKKRAPTAPHPPPPFRKRRRKNCLGNLVRQWELNFCHFCHGLMMPWYTTVSTAWHRLGRFHSLIDTGLADFTHWLTPAWQTTVTDGHLPGRLHSFIDTCLADFTHLLTPAWQTSVSDWHLPGRLQSLIDTCLADFTHWLTLAWQTLLTDWHRPGRVHSLIDTGLADFTHWLTPAWQTSLTDWEKGAHWESEVLSKMPIGEVKYSREVPLGRVKYSKEVPIGRIKYSTGVPIGENTVERYPLGEYTIAERCPLG